MKIGDKIRRLRLQRGLTQAELGDRTERVRKDECFYFRPAAPHKLVNAGKGACRVLWVSAPPSF